MVKGAVEQVWLPRADGARRPGGGDGARPQATCRCSPTRTASPRRRRRWARSSPSSRTASAASCGASRGRSTSASSTAPPAPSAPTSLAAARRRLARRVARLRRGPRPHVEPADHADREPRLAGRALRRRRALQPDPAQPLHRRVDLHLDGLLRARCAGRAPSGRRRCRTRSTRSASRTPRPTSR